MSFSSCSEDFSFAAGQASKSSASGRGERIAFLAARASTCVYSCVGARVAASQAAFASIQALEPSHKFLVRRASYRMCQAFMSSSRWKPFCMGCLGRILPHWRLDFDASLSRSLFQNLVFHFGVLLHGSCVRTRRTGTTTRAGIFATHRAGTCLRCACL